MNLDETVGILGVVTALLIHGGLLHVVELGTITTSDTALNDSVALVKLQLDITSDVALGESDRLVEELTLGREVLTVVEGTRVGNSDVGVTESTELTVQSQTLEILVGVTEDGTTGSFIAATRLDANETRLDNVDTANTVATSDGVEVSEQSNGLRDLSVVVVVHNLDGDTLLERDGDTLGGVGSILGVDGQLPHVLGGSNVGVLKDTSLVRDVEQVLIGRPRLGGGLDDRDALLGGERKKILAASEALKEN